MKSTADIVIIGAGVQGVGLAFHLAKAGAGAIVVLEKQHVAAGPTAKSGAMIRPLFSQEIYIRLVLQATTAFEHWDDVYGADPGFVQKGFFRITDTLDVDRLGGDLPLMEQLSHVSRFFTLRHRRGSSRVDVGSADRGRVPRADDRLLGSNVRRLIC